MSAVTSRPRISGVASAVTAESVMAGAALAALLLRAAGSAVRAAARPALRAVTEGVIPPLRAARDQETSSLAAVAGAAGSLAATDRIRVEAAASLAGYVVADVQRLAAPLRALRAAVTPAQAMRAREDLLQAVRVEHGTLFTRCVVSACARAADTLGFSAVDTRVTADGTVRIVAEHPAGHALVSELRTSAEGDAALETEVIGVYDGSCGDILDRFDAALEAAGVRSSAPARTCTGGVCQLAAARDFVGGILRPKPEARVPAASEHAHARRRNVRPQASQRG
ncbi:MAG TPA: hypothetical protein VF092_12325 [Longimicrobium sp.]